MSKFQQTMDSKGVEIDTIISSLQAFFLQFRLALTNPLSHIYLLAITQNNDKN